jgi:hypothetical protein
MKSAPSRRGSKTYPEGHGMEDILVATAARPQGVDSDETLEERQLLRECNGDRAMAQTQTGGTAAHHRQSIAVEPLGHARRRSWLGRISRESAGPVGQWSGHSRQRWFWVMLRQ